MMRSPSSASATSSERKPSVGISKVSTSPSAAPSTSVARTGKLTHLGQELTCALLADGSDMAQAVALGDRDEARQHDEHAGPDFSRFE